MFLSLAGGELFDRVADENYKMTEAEVINYMRQICDGVKYMHDNCYVHLDIKVRNFLKLLQKFTKLT